MSKIVFRITDALVEKLKTNYGPIVKTEHELKRLISPEDVIYCVGDRVSYEIIRCSLRPQAIFYDGLTERRETEDEIKETIARYNVKQLVVQNPKGTITEDLLNAIKTAETEKIKVQVEGEEDLTTLALASHIEKGTIIYGIPKKGMCVVKLDRKLKETAKRMFSEGLV